jgi:hypothetical protein
VHCSLSFNAPTRTDGWDSIRPVQLNPTKSLFVIMERFPPTVNDVVKLTQLGSLLSESVKVVTDEWSREQYDTSQTSGVDNARFLPSKRLHQAQRTILAVSGALNEMVIEPFNRLQEVAAQFWESRALGVTVERRIPDILHEAGNAGMDVQILAQRTGIEPHKLCMPRSPSILSLANS